MTQRILIALTCCLLSIATGVAQEKVTLTMPVFTDAGVSGIRFWTFYAKVTHPDSPAELRVIFRETLPNSTDFKPNGRSVDCAIADSDGVTQAENQIRTINKGEFLPQTLVKWIVDRCQKAGKLGAGTISGVPQ